MQVDYAGAEDITSIEVTGEVNLEVFEHRLQLKEFSEFIELTES